MSTYNYHYKKRLPTTFIAAVVVAGIAIAALPLTFANAQGNNQSPVADIVESFFKSRGNDHGSSNLFDFIPPGIAKKIFDHYQMPGSGHDETDPTISDIETDVDEGEITLSWSTDERTRGEVYISEESPVDEDDADTSTLSSWKLSKQHSVSTDDLEEDTTYYALIKATDKAGNETYSNEISFTLDEDDDDEGPLLSDIDWDSSSTSIGVTWDTDENASSHVYTSTSTGFALTDSGVKHTENTSLTTSHTLMITGLAASTTYYHRIVSIDDDGNKTQSNQYTIATD